MTILDIQDGEAGMHFHRNDSLCTIANVRGIHIQHPTTLTLKAINQTASSNDSATPSSPKPLLHIRPVPPHLHRLLPLHLRIELLDHLFHPLQRLLIRPLALAVHAADERATQRFLLLAREVLVDAFAQLDNAEADFFAVV